MCSKSVLLDFHLKQDTHGQILSCSTGPCPHWFWWSSFAVAGHCDLPRHSRASCTPRHRGANHDSCTAKQDSGTSLQPSLCGNMPIQTTGIPQAPDFVKVILNKGLYRYSEKGLSFHFLDTPEGPQLFTWQLHWSADYKEDKGRTV